MTARSLVDPELLPMLDRPDFVFSAATLPDIRAALAAEMAALPKIETPSVTIETIMVPGSPTIRVVAYRPHGDAEVLPAVLHIHGGGYVLGTPEIADAANRALAAQLGCAVFSVDYRLAPETPHPGPIEDCYSALIWLHTNAAVLGIDPRRIGIKGESAGGGLAAALALLARDRGVVPLAFQHLIYPMLDDRTCRAADPHPFAGAFVWTPAHNRFGWESLLGASVGGADVSPYAAAARATDLAGLPPCFIAVGALDLFVEENLDYARRLSRAGVEVELHVYPGAFHGFQMMAQAKVAIAAERDSLDALRRVLLG